MEILVVIVAFWLVILGVYGALPLFKGRGIGGAERPRVRVERRPTPLRQGGRTLPAAAASPNELAASTGALSPRGPQVAGLFSEVDLLRAQVEQLRSEIGGQASFGTWGEKQRTRSHPTGASAQLPTDLRRHVQEVRNTRRYMSL